VRIISFAWTTPALLAGRKTVTRRDWSHGYALRFHAGDDVAAYDRNPRHGGRQVATIRLTADPYRESTKAAAEEDYEGEGFAFLSGQGIKVDGLPPAVLWRAWHLYPETLWVIRFEVVERRGHAPLAIFDPVVVEAETPQLALPMEAT
jgi:hypothetical protein